MTTIIYELIVHLSNKHQLKENKKVQLKYTLTVVNQIKIRILFNESDANFSDAYPVNSHIVIISSTKIGGIGQYDLYLADMVTEKKWSLNLYNPFINSNNNELGACYSPYIDHKKSTL